MSEQIYNCQQLLQLLNEELYGQTITIHMAQDALDYAEIELEQDQNSDHMPDVSNRIRDIQNNSKSLVVEIEYIGDIGEIADNCMDASYQTGIVNARKIMEIK